MEEGTMAFDEFRGLDLRRVVVAPKQTGESVQVLAVELYEDGVIVRFLLPGGLNMAESAEEAAIDPMGEMSFMLSDDVGTRYKWSGARGGGAPAHRGDVEFVPAVPDAATQLNVVTVEGPVEIPLTA